MYGAATSYLDETFYGQATDNGTGDNVEMYDAQGQPATTAPNLDPAFRLAWVLVVISLALLWVLGAAIFRGSNQS